MMEKDCVMILKYAACETACGILKGLFDRLHDVARALLDGLLEDVKPGRLNVNALSGLAVQSNCCKIVSRQMVYTADLKSLATLERITKQLRCPL